jgi:hypothetical protein
MGMKPLCIPRVEQVRVHRMDDPDRRQALADLVPAQITHEQIEFDLWRRESYLTERDVTYFVELDQIGPRRYCRTLEDLVPKWPMVVAGVKNVRAIINKALTCNYEIVGTPMPPFLKLMYDKLKGFDLDKRIEVDWDACRQWWILTQIEYRGKPSL